MKVAYRFDPFELTGIEIKNPSKRDRAREEVADYVKEQILSHVGDGKSPVAGGAWKRTLSKEYKKRKAEISGAGFANMELYGDMLDALDSSTVGRREVEVGFSGSEGDKADGHNNFSGRSNLPARESIPNSKKGQTFKREIIKGIESILRDYADED